MDRAGLEALVRQVLLEQLGAGGVRSVPVPQIRVTSADRLDTGDPSHRVYTHDLFSLAESPRLGAGVMEMERTTFPWTLEYDEMDYVVEGQLRIITGGRTVTAGPGELIYIPKGSTIQFSVPERARFLYFVYPADWQNQPGPPGPGDSR